MRTELVVRNVQRSAENANKLDVELHVDGYNRCEGELDGDPGCLVISPLELVELARRLQATVRCKP